MAAAGWGHIRAAGHEHSRVPSRASPVGLVAASSVRSQHLAGTAGLHNS